jgi:hypothetical protein
LKQNNRKAKAKATEYTIFEGQITNARIYYIRKE